MGAGPHGIAISPDGSRAYVANKDGKSVSVIDTATNSVIKTVALSKATIGVAVTPDGRRVYVNESSGKVRIIDTAANKLLDSDVAVGSKPQRPSVTPDGTHVYVANKDDGTVSVIKTATNKVAATITVGTKPRWGTITPDGSRFYVTNSGSNSVSVIDTATNVVVTTVGVGTDPRRVAIGPDGSRAFATNYGSGNISMIDTASNAVVAMGPTSGSSPLGIALVPNQAPVASFTHAAAQAGSPTSFNASGSNDNDGQVARYHWDFGDGTTMANGGATPSHVFQMPGTYTTTLTVTDNEGCSMTQIFTGQTVSCNGKSTARYSAAVDIPAAPGAFTPDWVLSVRKNRRSRTVGLRFGMSSMNMNLKRMTLLTSRGLRVNLKRVPSCKVTRSTTSTSGLTQGCKRSAKVGRIYYQYPGSEIVKRNLYHYNGKGGFAVNRLTTGQNAQTTDAAQRSPAVNSIFVTRSGRLRIRLGVERQAAIQRVGVVLDGRRFKWLRYSKRLRSRICGFIVTTNQSNQRYTERKCRRARSRR